MKSVIPVLIFSGIFAIWGSFMLLFWPAKLKKTNDFLNRIMFTDENAIVYRKKTGWFLVLISFIFFWISYSFLK